MIVTPYNSTADKTPATDVRVAKKTLGSEDFMKLLSVQFQSQDPMKPMEDTAFIAQMAQFSSLSQTQTLTDQMAKLSASQAQVAANSYIGFKVTVDDGNGGTASGDVTGVETSTAGPRIVVGDKTYPISSVLLVEPGSASNQTTPATGSTGT